MAGFIFPVFFFQGWGAGSLPRSRSVEERCIMRHRTAARETRGRGRRGNVKGSNRLQAVPFWIVDRSREIAEREKKLERTSGGGPGVSTRLFLLAPVSLRYEHTISTNQKGTACSLRLEFIGV